MKSTSLVATVIAFTQAVASPACALTALEASSAEARLTACAKAFPEELVAARYAVVALEIAFTVALAACNVVGSRIRVCKFYLN